MVTQKRSRYVFVLKIYNISCLSKNENKKIVHFNSTFYLWLEKQIYFLCCPLPHFISFQDGIFLKLKIRQISLLLSSLWVQAISPTNTPENYEAIAHTYSLVVLFSQTKVVMFFLLVDINLHH